MSGQIIDIQKGFVGPLSEKIKTLGDFLELNVREDISHKGQAKLLRFEPGDVIINEGEFDNWVYWLIDGSVDVTKNGVKIKHFKRFGDMFGEMGIMEGEPRSASIVSDTVSICLKVDASIIDHLSPEKKARCWSNFLSNIAHEGKNRLVETTDKLAAANRNLLKYKKALREEKINIETLKNKLDKLQARNDQLKKFILDKDFMDRNKLRKIIDTELTDAD